MPAPRRDHDEPPDPAAPDRGRPVAVGAPAPGPRALRARALGDAGERRADAARLFAECLDRWESAGFDYGVVEETEHPSGRRRRWAAPRGLPSTARRCSTSTTGCARAVHGRGLATEAARAWTAHALEWLPDLPVVARSRRSATAVGAGGPRGRSRARRDRGDDGPDGEHPRPCCRRRGWRRPTGSTRRRGSPARPLVRRQRRRGRGRFPPGRAAPRRSPRALAAHEEGMADGGTTAVLLRAPASRVVGAGFWVADRNPLLGHARTAYRIMTAPRMRGRNLGRLLLAAMHRVAREQGVEVGGARRAQRAGDDPVLRAAAATSRSDGCPASSGSRPATTGTASSWRDASTGDRRWSPTAGPDRPHRRLS